MFELSPSNPNPRLSLPYLFESVALPSVLVYSTEFSVGAFIFCARLLIPSARLAFLSRRLLFHSMLAHKSVCISVLLFAGARFQCDAFISRQRCCTAHCFASTRVWCKCRERRARKTNRRENGRRGACTGRSPIERAVELNRCRRAWTEEKKPKTERNEKARQCQSKYTGVLDPIHCAHPSAWTNILAHILSLIRSQFIPIHGRN